jgi:hypothetical protein
MASLTLLLALLLTVKSVLITGVVASRYRISDDDFFDDD